MDRTIVQIYCSSTLEGKWSKFYVTYFSPPPPPPPPPQHTHEPNISSVGVSAELLENSKTAETKAERELGYGEDNANSAMLLDCMPLFHNYKTFYHNFCEYLFILMKQCQELLLLGRVCKIVANFQSHHFKVPTKTMCVVSLESIKTGQSLFVHVYL